MYASDEKDDQITKLNSIIQTLRSEKLVIEEGLTDSKREKANLISEVSSLRHIIYEIEEQRDSQDNI